jgi:hypothetical protein
MRLRFTGTYTGGHTSITLCGVTFDGREPSEVTDAESIRRLSGHPEFETVHPLDHDGDGHKGGSLPKKRGRPRKVEAE